MTKAVYSKMSRAKAQLILSQPFFASLLMRRDLVERTDIKALAIDHKGNVYFNPTYVEGMEVPNIVFGLAHEVMHMVFNHAARRGARDEKRWNRAADAVVNETLIADNVGEFIQGEERYPNANNMTTEEVYDLLKDDNGDGDGDGKGDSPGSQPQGGLGQDLLNEGQSQSEAERSEQEARLKVDIAQAAQAAKMAGKLPAGISRMVEAWLTVKTPWQQVLERFMVELVKSNEYSWARPNRRFIGGGLYLPGTSTEPRMGEVTIVVDTSGSIDQEMLSFFGGHINTIIEQCVPERVRVIYCDAAVNHVDIFTPDEYPVQMKAVGGGGTNLEQSWAYLEEEGITPDVAVVLTDMYTAFNFPPEFPVIWAATTDRVAPYGTTIQVEL